MNRHEVQAIRQRCEGDAQRIADAVTEMVATIEAIFAGQEGDYGPVTGGTRANTAAWLHRIADEIGHDPAPRPALRVVDAPADPPPGQGA